MPQLSTLKKLVTAKRGCHERTGVHSWHPYYAGYSEAFVSSAIKYLGINQSETILDPWHGSGTTSLVASRFQINTIGCEINPVMNIFSTAKSGFLINHINLLRTLSIEIAERSVQSLLNVKCDDPLLDFMSESLIQSVRALYREIDSQNYPKIVFANTLFQFLVKTECSLNPFEAFFKAALFITARKLAGYKGGSNPTWVKTLVSKPDYCVKDVVLTWMNTIELMIRDLEFSSIPKLITPLHLSLEADSRNLPICSESIDGIITSPPYLTRIDYAMSTKPEILIIGNPSVLRITREKTIGAPVIVNKNIDINSIWGETCLKVLQQVAKHRSKAAVSYYLPTMLQYFNDIEFSIKEIIRILKPQKQALIVVQSSYFKEHEINLGEIYVELCNNLGVRSKIVNRDVVRGHMAHVNTKSSLYKSKKIYYEDVVCVEK